MAVVCCLLLSILFIISYANGVLPDTALLLRILIVGCIGFPLVIVLWSVIYWLLKHKRQVRLYEVLSLNSNLYSDMLEYQHAFWLYTAIIKSRTVGGYIVKIMKAERGFQKVRLEIPLKWREIEKEEFRYLTRLFNPHGISLEIAVAVMELDLRNYKDRGGAMEAFERAVMTFVRLLQENRLEPEYAPQL